MARRFTGSRPRVQGPKRLTQWGLGPGGTGGTGITASQADILGSGVTFGASGTVVRIRGTFSGILTSYTTAGDGYAGAVGIGLASLAAFTAGIASLPTPLTEGAWDGWLWHKHFFMHGTVAAGSAAGAFVKKVDVEIDTKAMRKVSDEMIIFAASEVLEAGTAALILHLNSRLLLKLG